MNNLWVDPSIHYGVIDIINCMNLILYAYSQTSQLYATLQCSRFSHIFILVVDIYNYFSWIMIAL